MNAESPTLSPESAPTAATPGKRIREVRERLGISQARLAEQLRLNLAVVQALENDRYDDIAAPLFVRGYLRNVAKVLGIDEGLLVSGYDQFLAVDTVPELARVSQPADDGGMDIDIVRFGAIAIVVATVGLAALWWQGQTAEPEIGPAANMPGLAENAGMPDMPERPGTGLNMAAPGLAQRPTTDPIAPPPTDGRPAMSPRRAEPSIDSLGDVTLGFGPDRALDGDAADTANATETFDAADSDAPPADSSAPPTELDDMPTPPADAPSVGAPSALVITAERDAWLEVTDASGRRLYYNTAGAGERIALDGTSPYQMVIGNAAYVTVLLNGRPVDLQGVSEQGVARLSVGEAQTPTSGDFE